MRFTPLLLLVTIFATSSLQAKDFGKAGSVFEIAEEGFVSMMQRKLSTLDMSKHQQEMIDIASKHVQNPTPLNIGAALEDREYYYDPTYVLDRDAKLPNGEILYKAGRSVNPLEHMSLDRVLIFIDGRDLKQVTWLKEYIEEYRKSDERFPLRIVLTGGKIFELKEEIGEDLYFDQTGELTNKFGIKFVPAIAEQDGVRLKIKELYIGEKINEQKKSNL